MRSLTTPTVTCRPYPECLCRGTSDVGAGWDPEGVSGVRASPPPHDRVGGPDDPPNLPCRVTPQPHRRNRLNRSRTKASEGISGGGSRRSGPQKSTTVYPGQKRDVPVPPPRRVLRLVPETSLSRLPLRSWVFRGRDLSPFRVTPTTVRLRRRVVLTGREGRGVRGAEDGRDGHTGPVKVLERVESGRLGQGVTDEVGLVVWVRPTATPGPRGRGDGERGLLGRRGRGSRTSSRKTVLPDRVPPVLRRSTWLRRPPGHTRLRRRSTQVVLPLPETHTPTTSADTRVGPHRPPVTVLGGSVEGMVLRGLLSRSESRCPHVERGPRAARPPSRGTLPVTTRVVPRLGKGGTCDTDGPRVSAGRGQPRRGGRDTCPGSTCQDVDVSTTPAGTPVRPREPEWGHPMSVGPLPRALQRVFTEPVRPGRGSKPHV